MATLLVGYDLNTPGQDYSALIKKLKSYNGYWHYLDSTWLVRANLSPVQLREQLTPLIDRNDELLVIDVTGRGWAGKGFVQRAYTWLKNHL